MVECTCHVKCNPNLACQSYAEGLTGKGVQASESGDTSGHHGQVNVTVTTSCGRLFLDDQVSSQILVFFEACVMAAIDKAVRLHICQGSLGSLLRWHITEQHSTLQQQTHSSSRHLAAATHALLSRGVVGMAKPGAYSRQPYRRACSMKPPTPPAVSGYTAPVTCESEALWLLPGASPLQCTRYTPVQAVLPSCCRCLSSLCTILEKVSSQGGIEPPV